MKAPPRLRSSSLSYFASLVSESLRIRTKENTWLETLGCSGKTTIILQTLISLSYRSGRHAGCATIPTFLARFCRRCPTIQWKFDAGGGVRAGEANRLWNEKKLGPKFPEISVQNSMDRFVPTGKSFEKTFWGGLLFPVGPVVNLVEWIAP